MLVRFFSVNKLTNFIKWILVNGLFKDITTDWLDLTRMISASRSMSLSRYSSLKLEIWCQHTSHIVHCFSFSSTNIELWLKRRKLQLFEQYILRYRGTFIDCVQNCRFCLQLGVKYWECICMKATFENLSITRKQPYVAKW